MKTSQLEEMIRYHCQSDDGLGVGVPNSSEISTPGGGQSGHWLLQYDYETAIEHMFQRSPFPFWWITQYLQKLDCGQDTCSLARLYFTRYCLARDQIATHQLELIKISSIRLAIKFNQCATYPLEVVIAHTKGQFTKEQLIESQTELLTALQFRMARATPYSFLAEVQCLLPLPHSQVYGQLSLLIEYAEQLRQFCFMSAGSIFFGALLYLVKKHEPALSELILRAIASRWGYLDFVQCTLRKRIDATIACESIQQGMENWPIHRCKRSFSGSSIDTESTWPSEE